jgi:hypothetical protein
MRSSFVLATAALLLGVSGSLAAQSPSCQCGIREVNGPEDNPNRRSGPWAAIGLGGGAESFNTYNGFGWSHDQWGGVGYIKAGLALGQTLSVGGEGTIWLTDYADHRRTLGSIMIIGQLYPVPRGGFFLKGGGGWTRDVLRQYFVSGPSTQFSQDGWGVVAGLGYDIRIAPNSSITPTVDFVLHRYHTQDERLIILGLGFTFH